jgi:hypothetical protein
MQDSAVSNYEEFNQCILINSSRYKHILTSVGREINYLLPLQTVTRPY